MIRPVVTSDVEIEESDYIDMQQDIMWDLTTINKEPYLIPENDPLVFTSYNIPSFQYFTMDDVMIDDAEDVVNDPATILGFSIWNSLKVTKDRTLYVRNNACGKIYEVNILHNESYKDYIEDQQ